MGIEEDALRRAAAMRTESAERERRHAANARASAAWHDAVVASAREFADAARRHGLKPGRGAHAWHVTVPVYWRSEEDWHSIDVVVLPNGKVNQRISVGRAGASRYEPLSREVRSENASVEEIQAAFADALSRLLA